MDLCKDQAPSIRGEFTSHSGVTAKHSERVAIAGCGPRAELTLRRLRGARPSLTLTVSRSPGDAALGAVRLRLPQALRVHPGRVGRGLRARGDGADPGLAHPRRHADGARSEERRPHRRAGARARSRLGRRCASASAKRPRLTFRLQVADAGKAVTRQTLLVRVKR